MSRWHHLATLTITTLMAVTAPWTQPTDPAPVATPDSAPDSAPGSTLAPADIAEFVEEYAEANMAAAGVPGLVFVHVDGAEVVTTAAYGLADLDQERPMTVDTPLRVGSISKPVTAALAFELAAEGMVDLDAPVDRYLDVDLSDDHGPASTIRQLLYHRGGYPDAIVASHHTEAGGARPLDEWTAALPPRTMAPDIVPSYSSVGYTVAGAALAGAAGQDFDTLARAHLFDPVGMTGATFIQPPPPSVAIGYRGVAGLLSPIPLDEADLAPGAGLTSSAVDVGHFMAALLGPNGLAPSTTHALLTLSAGDPDQRGLTAGLAEWRYDHRSVLYHEGNGIGTSNRMMLLPTEGVGFFTAVNGAALSGMGDPSTQNRFVRELHAQIIERFYPHPVDLRRVVAGRGSGRPTDGVDGTYIPTRIDANSIMRLEALVAQHEVTTTADGIEWNGTALRPETGEPAGVYRTGDQTVVFAQGPDGVTYAARGGTGSYRRATLWETTRFNLTVVTASIALAVAALAVGLFRTPGWIRWMMLTTGTSIIAFVGLLGFALSTVEAMDLFTGLTVPIRLAQGAAATMVVSTAMLMVAVAVGSRARGTGTPRLTWASSGAMMVAGVTMSAWAWYWHALPI